MTWLWLSLVVALSTAVVRLVWRVKTADERAARMESRLAALLEGQDAGLSVWNRDGHLVACTQRFRDFYPTIQLTPGFVFEDLIRFTAARGPIQIDPDVVESWVGDRVNQFGQSWRGVARTPDGRWIEIDTRPTHSGEVILSFAETTGAQKAEGPLSVGGVRTGPVEGPEQVA